MLQAVRHPPGPTGVPLLRNLMGFTSGDILSTWRVLHAQYGETVRLKLGLFETISFAGAEAIHQALVTEHKIMRKGWGYAGLRKLLGEGLVTTDAPHWASERQALNPIFSPAAADGYAGTIYDAVSIGVDEIAARAAVNPSVDLGAAMLRLTMRVISRAVFGVDLGEGHDDVTKALACAFDHVADSVTTPLRAPDFVPTRANRDYRAAVVVIEDFIASMIDKARAHPDATTMSGKVISVLEGNPKQLLRDEVISLYFAGFETTARTMTFLMYELGRQAMLRERVRREAQNFVRPDGALSVLKQLPLCCEIVNETLRLYPPVAMVARQPAADCEIGGYPVRAGTLIVVVPFVTQRDTRYWPAGDRFAPDPDNPLSKRLAHKGAFAPFGGGPRICLGKHFAMVEMAIATALLCSRFEWTLETDDEPELEFNGTIHPKVPIRASFVAAG
jgi:cytochrome P450